MSKSKPFELVFKRGGDTPEEKRSWHATAEAARQHAEGELRRQRNKGWDFVWMAYDLWDTTGKRRCVARNVVLQNPR